MTTQYSKKRLQSHTYKNEIITLNKHTRDTKHTFNFHNKKYLKKIRIT